MKFIEKLKEVVKEIVSSNQGKVSEEAHISELIYYLKKYIDNWPIVAQRFSEGELDVEEIDLENNEIDIHDTHLHIWCGGDWQDPIDFDIVLNPNDGQPFVACNIQCESNANDAIDLDEE